MKKYVLVIAAALLACSCSLTIPTDWKDNPRPGLQHQPPKQPNPNDCLYKYDAAGCFSTLGVPPAQRVNCENAADKDRCDTHYDSYDGTSQPWQK